LDVGSGRGVNRSKKADQVGGAERRENATRWSSSGLMSIIQHVSPETRMFSQLYKTEWARGTAVIAEQLPVPGVRNQNTFW
jgi:hypothetical protein